MFYICLIANDNMSGNDMPMHMIGLTLSYSS